MVDARTHLESLVGTEIYTLTRRMANRILHIEGDDVVVSALEAPSLRVLGGVLWEGQIDGVAVP